MGKVIDFPIQKLNDEDIDIDKMYDDFYNSEYSNISQSEYILGVDYDILEDGTIINLWKASC